MGFKSCKGLILALTVLSVSPLLPAQDTKEQADSLVRLMQGSSIALIEEGPFKYRRAIDATFLHNGTYLICDTALWNVDAKVIDAWGNVKLIQDETILSSDNLKYLIDDNLAQFRGSVVQLQNKENNILRTANLDYNTKDSTAIFRDGGAMKDKDGQIIEGRDGIYDSRRKTFDFDRDVNMYSDTVFVKTSHLLYDSEKNTAYFTEEIDFWNEGNMLSAGGGWYNRGSETFFFSGKVHGLSERQESWSDTLFVFKNTKDVEMLGNAQLQDTSRHVTAMAEFIFYNDSVSTVTMKNQAAVALFTNENGKRDTIYAGADTIVYRSVKKCDIPESVFSEAQGRLNNITFDAVAEFRRKSAEAAAKARAEAEAKALEEDPNAGPKLKQKKEEAPVAAPAADTTSSAKDTLTSAVDTLLAVTDTVPPLPDTTKIGFMTAVGKVRIFRRDIQARCDSLDYCDLDSIARFYVKPVVWNDGNRQYTSDSMYVLVRNGGMDRASLMGNAFIITQEDEIRFDQIKSTEVMAYFDSTSALKRFDALGGANAMFYLRENDALATVNKVECKMLSAIMSGGQLDKVFYYDSPKNDAFPVAQMTDRDHKLKGFEWKGEQKPCGPADITTLQLKTTERDYYEKKPKASFVQTDRFFPGYMQSVYDGIEEARRHKNAPKPVLVDSLSIQTDILGTDSLVVALPDSLRDKIAVPDSLVIDTPLVSGNLPVSDSLEVSAADSLLMIPPTKKELREEARKLAIARRDARWAKKDIEEAEKAAAKEQKKIEKKRERTRKLLVLLAEQEARDAAKLEKYRQRYERKKLKEDERAAALALKKKNKQKDTNEQEPESSGERTPEIIPEGNVQTLDGAGRETL